MRARSEHLRQLAHKYAIKTTAAKNRVTKARLEQERKKLLALAEQRNVRTQPNGAATERPNQKIARLWGVAIVSGGPPSQLLNDVCQVSPQLPSRITVLGLLMQKQKQNNPPVEKSSRLPPPLRFPRAVTLLRSAHSHQSIMIDEKYRPLHWRHQSA